MTFLLLTQVLIYNSTCFNLFVIDYVFFLLRSDFERQLRRLAPSIRVAPTPLQQHAAWLKAESCSGTRGETSEVALGE